MNKRATTMAFSVLIVLMICALSVTCDETNQRKPQLQTTESGACTDKIISCGFDHICPYPGQHIEVRHEGDPSCGDTICICHCSQSTATDTSTGH